MPHNYELRNNPKRKIQYSPSTSNLNTKKINLNSTQDNMSTNTTPHNQEPGVSGANQQPPIAGGDDLNQRHLNAGLPVFVPTSRNGQGRMLPPHHQRQHPLPPNAYSNYQPMMTNDPNLANYIQNAICEGIRSNRDFNNGLATEMVTAMRGLTERIERGFQGLQEHIIHVNNARIDNPNACDVPLPSTPQELASGPNAEAQEDDPITRLECLVQNLSIRVSAMNQRVNGPNSTVSNLSIQGSQGVSSRVPIEKWKVKFKGASGNSNDMTADDLLNILAVKRENNDVTWEYIGRNFDFFLEGRALSWYYSYKARNMGADWPTLKEAFIQNFRRKTSDEEIMVKIANRKQGEKESFDDFCDAMRDLRNKLCVDYSDNQFIGLVRNNCKLAIRQMMATYIPSSLNDFIDRARNCDKLLLPSGSNFANKKIHEIQDDWSSVAQSSLSSNKEEVLSKPFVEAFKKRSGSLVCWNCDEPGHIWVDCEQDRKTFCYKCGQKNATCRTCRCANFRIQEIASGDLPIPTIYPDLNSVQRN